MRDFQHFGMTNCVIFVISGYASQLIQDSVANHFKAITAPYSHCTLSNINYSLPLLRKILNLSFCVVENLHCNFNTVEHSICTYHIVENITKYIPYCGNYQGFFQKILLTI